MLDLPTVQLGFFGAYLLFPPIIFSGLVAGRYAARLQKFPTRCVMFALCLGYSASIASYHALLRHWPCIACRFGQSAWLALVGPLLVTLLIALAIGRAFKMRCSVRTFAGACVFAHIHLCAFYVYIFWAIRHGQL